MTIQERFASHYLVDHRGCWLWTGGKNEDMRGSFYMNGKQTPCHRAAWLLFRGPIPAGACVCHTCDVPYCVNPDHLWVGSQRDNLRDCVAKGRHPFQHTIYAGEKNPHAKYTQIEIEAMRAYPGTARQAARVFGTSKKYVQQIRQGGRWKTRALDGTP